MKLSATYPRLRLLRPSIFAAEVARIAGKLRQRARRLDGRQLTLPPDGTPRGSVLFSYIIDPFFLRPGEEPSHNHTNYWESRRMAETFRELGYEVDVINWTNDAFVPRKDYAVYVDARRNLERNAGHLPAACKKILHADTAHHTFHNAAQERRLAELAARRGIRLAARKLVEVTAAAEAADAITILGNAFTIGTYRDAGKPIHRIPISSPVTYPWFEGKDFAACRRRYLWFGSAGLVHKGLDLVLEAFAGMPDHHLTICGPIRRERDFESAYARELYGTPNIDTVDWIDIESTDFRRLAERTVGLVYPSCSEGGGGSVLTCMHAGIIPIVSPETSVDVEPATGVVVERPSVEELRAAIRGLSARAPAELEAMARAARDFARRHHTRERFAERYRQVVEEILA